MEREVARGIGMRNTCKPMAVSFQYMTKSTTKKKKRSLLYANNNSLEDIMEKTIIISIFNISEHLLSVRHCCKYLKFTVFINSPSKLHYVTILHMIPYFMKSKTSLLRHIIISKILKKMENVCQNH